MYEYENYDIIKKCYARVYDWHKIIYSQCHWTQAQRLIYTDRTKQNTIDPNINHSYLLQNHSKNFNGLW